MVQEIEKMHIYLSQKMLKESITAFAETVNAYDCNKILPLIADGDKELSSNAAYVLLFAYKGCENQLLEQTSFIMEVIQTTPYDKTRRLLLSLLERLALDTVNVNVKFLDYCFTNILSVKVACAIKASCIRLAFRQCAAYEELLSELKMVLDTMDASMLAPSVASARRNIMKKIDSTLSIR